MTKAKSITAAVISTAIVLGHSAFAGHAEDATALKLAPLKGMSFDVGGKQALTYFVTSNGACKVTLLVTENVDTDAVVPQPGARISVAVDSGKAVRLDTPEGKSLEFKCEAAAKSMTITPVEQMAWVAPKV